MNLNENINRIKEVMGLIKEDDDKNFKMISTDVLRRPNGHIGTQGFTSESLLNLLKHISSVEGFELPRYETLKELINKIRETPEMINSILEYVKSDPIEIYKLPDDSYHIKDGNHRANLLNLLNVPELPIKNI